MSLLKLVILAQSTLMITEMRQKALHFTVLKND
jgi:hypothetical protein